MPNNTSLIVRLEQLESQLAFQDDTIESLNQLVTQQNKELSEIHEQLRWLGRKLNQMQANDSAADTDPNNEPPPPHY